VTGGGGYQGAVSERGSDIGEFYRSPHDQAAAVFAAARPAHYHTRVGGTVPAGDERLRQAAEGLLAGATDAIVHLADLDAEDDLEGFGIMLDRLIETSRALIGQAQAAGGGAQSWVDQLGAVLGRLREAHDLLDDGEPSDAVAFEVMAARDRLRDALQT
jgi:hypothetical protein